MRLVQACSAASVVVALIWSTAAHAQLLYGEYADEPPNEIYGIYVRATHHALQVANHELTQSGLLPLYCAPAGLEMTVWDAEAVVKAYAVGRKDELRNWPMAKLMIVALAERFPCR